MITLRRLTRIALLVSLIFAANYVALQVLNALWPH
jgi:hypothetical protein